MNREYVLAKLKEIRVLLDQPMHWGKNSQGRDESGQPCSAASVHACSWCLDGAVQKVTHMDTGVAEERRTIYRLLTDACNTAAEEFSDRPALWNIHLFNDHPQVNHEMITKMLARLVLFVEATNNCIKATKPADRTWTWSRSVH